MARPKGSTNPVHILRVEAAPALCGSAKPRKSIILADLVYKLGGAEEPHRVNALCTPCFNAMVRL